MAWFSLFRLSLRSLDLFGLSPHRNHEAQFVEFWEKLLMEVTIPRIEAGVVLVVVLRDMKFHRWYDLGHDRLLSKLLRLD